MEGQILKTLKMTLFGGISGNKGWPKVSGWEDKWVLVDDGCFNMDIVKSKLCPVFFHGQKLDKERTRLNGGWILCPGPSNQYQ